MNVGEKLSLGDGDFVSWEYISRSGTDGSYGSSNFNWGTSIPFSLVLHQFTFWPTIYKCLLFFHILTRIFCLSSFGYKISYLWDDILFWFWYAFHWWLVMLNTFSCTCWSFLCHLFKNVYSDLTPIFNWVICFCAVELYEFLHILDINPYEICGF